MEAEWFTFGPESGRVEATDVDSDLRLKMMEIQITAIDAKLQGQMEKHQIVFNLYFKLLIFNFYFDFLIHIFISTVKVWPYYNSIYWIKKLKFLTLKLSWKCVIRSINWKLQQIIWALIFLTSYYSKNF